MIKATCSNNFPVCTISWGSQIEYILLNICALGFTLETNLYVKKKSFLEQWEVLSNIVEISLRKPLVLLWLSGTTLPFEDTPLTRTKESSWQTLRRHGAVLRCQNDWGGLSPTWLVLRTPDALQIIPYITNSA